jgi:hypothetical protein
MERRFGHRGGYRPPAMGAKPLALTESQVTRAGKRAF